MSHDATLTVTAPGYRDKSLRVGPLGGDPCLANVSLEKGQLSRVSVRGLDFRDENNNRWVYNGATNFLAFERFMLGQEPPLYKGANIHRFTCTMVNVPNQVGLPILRPENFPDYWQKLDEFADWLAMNGVYGEATLLCDCGQLGVDTNWQKNFLAQAAEVLGSKTNILIELVNEYWNNGVEPDRFSRPNIPNPCSSGSVMDGDEYGYDDTIQWDYIDVHPRRDYPKMLAHVGLSVPWVQFGKPLVVNEPFKANEYPESNKSYIEPGLFRVAGDLGRAVCGICFHSFDGAYSRALGPTQERCRQDFFLGSSK